MTPARCSEPGLFLGLDTALNRCAVALVPAAGPAVSAQEAMARGQAERLLPMIEDVLRQAGRSLADLDGLAVTLGPGTFTGIRIALAAARGLALVLGCPLIGFSTLQALAWTRAPSRPAHCLALVPAPRNRVFAQPFDLSAGRPEALAPPDQIPVEAAQARTPDQQVVWQADTSSLAKAVAEMAQAVPDFALPPVPLYLRPPDAARPGPNPLAERL